MHTEMRKADCGYKLSEGVEMNFKYFCVDGDKYFSHYEGQWQDSVKVEDSFVVGELEGEKEEVSE